MKLTKKENEILLFCVNTMSYYIHSDKRINEIGSALPRHMQNKAYGDALKRLRDERGFVWGYGLYPTPAGYAYLGVSPKFILLVSLTDELAHHIQHAARMRVEDQPSRGESSLAFFRELYQQADMTIYEMQSHERERIFNNRMNYERDIQALEQKIALVESLKD